MKTFTNASMELGLVSLGDFAVSLLLEKAQCPILSNFRAFSLTRGRCQITQEIFNLKIVI